MIVFISMNQRKAEAYPYGFKPHYIDTGLMNTRKRAEGIFFVCSMAIFWSLGSDSWIEEVFLPVQKHRNIIIFSDKEPGKIR